MQKTGVERFSISAPRDLIENFDRMVSKLGQDRSKAIQQAMRLFLSEYRWAEEAGPCAGAVVIIYNHEVHEAEEELTDLQHHFREVINSTLHLHIDDNNCLEIIAVRGDIPRVRNLIEKLSVCKGIRQIKHTVVGI